MNKIKSIGAIIITFVLTPYAYAADADKFKTENSAIGLWKTMDDKTQQPRSIVEIFEKDEKFYGKIVKIFPQPGNKSQCEKCPDEFKNQPILGLQLMWDLKKNSEKSLKYENGHILDPENGSIYKLKIELIEAGQKLDVRGYIGISLFGRSQQWNRVNQVD